MKRKPHDEKTSKKWAEFSRMKSKNKELSERALRYVNEIMKIAKNKNHKFVYSSIRDSDMYNASKFCLKLMKFAISWNSWLSNTDDTDQTNTMDAVWEIGPGLIIFSIKDWKCVIFSNINKQWFIDVPSSSPSSQPPPKSKPPQPPPQPSSQPPPKSKPTSKNQSSFKPAYRDASNRFGGRRH